MRILQSVFSPVIIISVLTIVVFSPAAGQQWAPKDPRLPTKWTSEITPSNVHQAYPRPAMVRDHWENLNGLWDFKITGKASLRGEYDEKILVPFPVESALSGIRQTVGAANRVWYRRSVRVSNPYQHGRVLLHFEASDWETSVFVNEYFVGTHQGGYDPFTFDITEYLTSGEDQEVVVTVWDPTDLGKQPVGKQTHDPRSIWYTANTGIWQTVWIEYVPQIYIRDVKITPELKQERVRIEAEVKNAEDEHRLQVTAMDNGEVIGTCVGYHSNRLYIPIDNPKMWSPDRPFLYDLEVVLMDGKGNQIDEVTSYFGMRSISVERAEDGYMRLFLNNEPLFQLGPLDQGWWPDGLYTAPTDEALKYDIQVTRDLGFNMLRKHVKVEPRRFYYWCDRLGILVWQDMPSGDMRPGQIPDRTAESARQFKREYRRMIDHLYNHPSIVMWVPFNEGWGQFRTEEIVQLTKDLDPTRLVDNASGWSDQQVGDVIDIHRYPGPGIPEIEDNRAAVLGEFGGQALVVKGHLWISDFSRAPGHYKTSQSESRLHQQYDKLLKALYPLKEQGLAAAVYTQTTDVESEVNGFMTYDRKVIKFDPGHLRKLHGRLTED